MPESLLTQIIGVSQRRDDRGNEAIIYAPAPLLGDTNPAPEPARRAVQSAVLQRHVESVRRKVEELTWRARLSGRRDLVGIEPEAQVLAEYVFPECGFVGLIEPGVHPQFDIVYDLAAVIPWEVLEERYFVCHGHRPWLTFVGQRGGVSSTVYCQQCGNRLEETGGKLAIHWHLTHLARGGRPDTHSGNEFLFVEDPSGDLCQTAPDASPSAEQHLADLKSMLSAAGFQPNVMRGKNATVRRFLAAISNPAVVGMYFFGHGFFPQDSDHGCLVLSDGPLYAGEIEAAAPGIRCVFLNACEGAAVGRNWTLEKRFRSVAHAFARGGPSKTVIAPLWPVVTRQAAGFAVDFFRAALLGKSLGVALQEARIRSVEAYQAGAADISWMAYRYFGDPNRELPMPREPSPPAASQAAVYRSRLFDGQDQLDYEVFGFDIASVLLRAAKRRNLQGRELVSVCDWLAGLIRVGHLSRFLLRSHSIDPDEFYRQLLEERETAGESGGERPAAADAASDPVSVEDRLARLRRLLAGWLVRERRQFDEPLLRVLAEADRLAQQRAEATGAKISEQDVLEAVTRDGQWLAPTRLALPPAASVRKFLELRPTQQTVDENGRLLLGPLSPMARRVIETAHELAEQRGAGGISNRLMMAAFLRESDGHAAQLGRAANVDVERLADVLIAGTESRPPVSFVLSPESGQRVVVPMLQCARVLQQESRQKVVTEAMLFTAYCRVAAPEFKELLRRLPPPLSVDLDQLRSVAVRGGERSRAKPMSPISGLSAIRGAHPNGGPSALEPTGAAPVSYDLRNLDDVARRVLIAAAECARIQGFNEVRSVHLFVGWVRLGTPLVQSCLHRHSVRPERICLSMLSAVVPQGGRPPVSSELMISPHVGRLLDEAVRLAGQVGKTLAGEREICLAILRDERGMVVQLCRQLGLHDLVRDPWGECSDTREVDDPSRDTKSGPSD